jgi:signal transduction histidine kinase
MEMTTKNAGGAVDAGTRELVDAIQRLSLAQTVGEVQEIVRTAARRLCGADGATFVLRDGDRCYYADEDAISPLWKGQRFPLESCISGWVMDHAAPVVIEDIYADDRIPHDAYRPTFVQSLAMVPIRSSAQPIGAIGNYWSSHHRAGPDEVERLQALADATAVAMTNVALWSDMEARVAERTAGLNEALKLNERLLGTLAHELRNTVGGSRGLLEYVLEERPDLGGDVREELQLAHRSVVDALRIVDEQLDLAKRRATQLAPKAADVPVATILAELAATYRAMRRNDAVALVVDPVAPGVALRTDAHLLKQVLRNLVSNALKFTDAGEVRLSAAAGPAEGEVTLTVSDTGLGIAPGDQERIFQEFAQVDDVQTGRPAGTGLGLPFVRRVTAQLGGRLELDSAPGRGSAFRVTLPRDLGRAAAVAVAVPT